MRHQRANSRQLIRNDMAALSPTAVTSEDDTVNTSVLLTTATTAVPDVEIISRANDNVIIYSAKSAPQQSVIVASSNKQEILSTDCKPDIASLEQVTREFSISDSDSVHSDAALELGPSETAAQMEQKPRSRSPFNFMRSLAKKVIAFNADSTDEDVENKSIDYEEQHVGYGQLGHYSLSTNALDTASASALDTASSYSCSGWETEDERSDDMSLDDLDRTVTLSCSRSRSYDWTTGEEEDEEEEYYIKLGSYPGSSPDVNQSDALRNQGNNDVTGERTRASRLSSEHDYVDMGSFATPSNNGNTASTSSDEDDNYNDMQSLTLAADSNNEIENFDSAQLEIQNGSYVRPPTLLRDAACKVRYVCKQLKYYRRRATSVTDVGVCI